MADVISVAALTASTALLALGALGVSLFVLKARREVTDHYDLERSRAQLEDVRRLLETQMRRLEDRLVSSEQRWADVNHLIISSQQAPSAEPHLATPTTKLSSYLKAMGLSETDVKMDRTLVFVLTPFHPEEDRTFETISEACREFGLRALRGDEEFVAGDILQHLLRLLVRARLVIANINGRNPNVFYELGIAQGIDKAVIVVSKSGGDAPFDVTSRRMVLYESLGHLRIELKNALTQALIQEEPDA